MKIENTGRSPSGKSIINLRLGVADLEILKGMLLQPIADWQTYMDEKIHYAQDTSVVWYPTKTGEVRKIVQALGESGVGE